MRHPKGLCLNKDEMHQARRCIEVHTVHIFLAHTSPYKFTYDHVLHLLQQTEMDDKFARPSLSKSV